MGALAGLLLACSAAPVGGEPVATETVNLPPSYRFEPALITVPAGTNVTWTNNDHFTHNVRVGEAGEPLLMRPGESVSHDFPTAGTYDYVCTLHPNDMQGRVIVTED